MANETPASFTDIADSDNVRRNIRYYLTIARNRATAYKNLDLSDPSSLKVNAKEHPSVALFKTLWSEYDTATRSADTKRADELLKLLVAQDSKINTQIDRHLGSLVSASAAAHKMKLTAGETSGDPMAGKSEAECIDELVKEGMDRGQATLIVRQAFAKEADVG